MKVSVPVLRPCFVQVTNAASQGPCHFGHLTTSGRRGGKTQWHSNPIVSYWLGKVPGGVTLCSMCYQSGNRSISRELPAKLPRYACQTQGVCPSPGTTLQQCLSTITAGLINNPPAGSASVDSVASPVPPLVLINKPAPVTPAQASSPPCSFSDKRRRNEAQPLLVLAPGHRPVNCIKVARRKMLIGGGKPTSSSSSLNSEHAACQSVSASKLDLVPATCDKGCNLEGIPDMHASGQVSVHPDAAPSVFKAFVMQPQTSNPSLYREVDNGDVHDIFSNLESCRLLDAAKYWGTFLTARGVKRKCDVPVSRASNCGQVLPSEIENSFLAKRRKLYSTPACFRVNRSQFVSDSSACFRSQRDNTVGTNAPT